MDLDSQNSKAGFSAKLWRGERMCLIGLNVEGPEEDLVGFAIQCQSPGSNEAFYLRNRLAFSYQPSERVTGARSFPSIEAPFQKFRWIHFPKEPKAQGSYVYTVTKMHMRNDGSLVE